MNKKTITTKQRLIFAAGAIGRWLVAATIMFLAAGFLVEYIGTTTTMFFTIIGGWNGG